MIEDIIIKKIKAKNKHPETFLDLVCTFEEKLQELNPTQNNFNVNDFFGRDIGQISATKKLLEFG